MYPVDPPMLALLPPQNLLLLLLLKLQLFTNLLLLFNSLLPLILLDPLIWYFRLSVKVCLPILHILCLFIPLLFLLISFLCL